MFDINSNQNQIRNYSGAIEEYNSPLQDEIISILKKFGPMTRAEIVGKLQKPRTTIYDSLMRLKNRNMVRKYSRQTTYLRGRPKVYFRLLK